MQHDLIAQFRLLQNLGPHLEQLQELGVTGSIRDLVARHRETLLRRLRRAYRGPSERDLGASVVIVEEWAETAFSFLDRVEHRLAHRARQPNKDTNSHAASSDDRAAAFRGIDSMVSDFGAQLLQGLRAAQCGLTGVESSELIGWTCNRLSSLPDRLRLND